MTGYSEDLLRRARKKGQDAFVPDYRTMDAMEVMDGTAQRKAGMTEPLYRQIRRILPDFGGIDFSPIVVLLLIHVLRILLGGLAADLAY